jgi:hypothetical protein
MLIKSITMARQKGVRYFLDWMISTKAKFTHQEFMKAYKKAQKIEDENITHAFMCGEMIDQMGSESYTEKFNAYPGWWPTEKDDLNYRKFKKEFYQ